MTKHIQEIWPIKRIHIKDRNEDALTDLFRSWLYNHYKPIDGDAIAALHRWINNHEHYLRGKDLAELSAIAAIIKRDYVRRDMSKD